MRVRLADVGDVPDMFEIGRGGRFRSMRNGATGSGGGSGESGGEGGSGEEEQETEDETDEEEEKQEEETPEALRERLSKVERTAKRRDAALRKAQAELAELRAKGEKKDDDEPDPVAKANSRLIAASARTVLAAAGITDKADQKAVISALNLSDIEVDEEDGPDEEEIEERLSELSRIFGGTTKPKPGSRTPRGVRAPDRGKGDTVDADTARYRRIMGTRG